MIFQSELTNLDTEFSRLQAQLAVLQQQRNLYSQLQQQTEGYLVGLARLKEQIAETVGGGAIASLKSAVLTLFDSEDHGQQEDEPSFVDEDSLEYSTLEGQFCDIGHDLDWYWERCAKPEGQAWEFASILEFDKPLVTGDRFWHGATWSTGTVIQQLGDMEYEVQIDGAIGTVTLDRPQLHYMPTSLEGQTSDIDVSPLTGQACDWASPFASHLASALWEDAPFIGQHCTINPSATEDNKNKCTSEGEPMPYVQFVEVSDKVGYIKVCHSGEIKATYAGFTRKDRAEAWGRLLAVTYEIASGFEVRPAKHLPFKWELKLWDMNINQIQKLAAEDLTKSPRVEVNSAKPPAREPAQAAEIAVGSSIRVLNWQHHDCNQSSDIATVLEIEDGMYQIDVKNSQGINIWLSRKAITPLSAEADQTLSSQAAGIEPPADWGKPQVEESSPTTTPTKKVRITLESSPWKGQDCEVLEVTPDGHWWKLRLPNGQELKYPGDTIEPVVETTNPIGFNDLVEVIADGNDCVGLVGSFGRVKVIGESRIGVEIDEQLVYLTRSELRIKAKEEKAPQRTSLQSGQLLMGDRVITTGKYIGERRVSQLLNAKLGTADKIAAIELAKDLKNLGFDPRLAATVMAGGEPDDASDF